MREIAALCLILILSLSFPARADEKKAKEKKPLPEGKPVLWQEPKDIETRDLYLGPGGASMKPELSRVTFIKEQKGGWSKKYRVRDARGREWVAKLGPEAQSETAASRLLWAVGYTSEITYLAPRVTIQGKGDFANVRFEARPKGVERLGEWTWEGNPFDGTRELQGLKVMMVLLNNWDVKDENNIIFHRPEDKKLLYGISDLGATFGKAGGALWKLTRSRNKPEDYADRKFIDGVKGDKVDFNYGGKMPELFDGITVRNARWIGGYLSRLSDRQLRDAFRAANYTPGEVQLLTAEVRARINDLVNLPHNVARTR